MTRENLELIEFVVDLAQRNGYKPENKELIKQICDQAITAQQLNQRSRIEQAAAVTDLNYISAYFAQFTIDEDPELMAFIVTGKAFGKATYKWGQFLYNLGFDKGVTLGKLAADTVAVGKCLGYGAAELYEQSPYAYRNDETLDFVDDVKEFFVHGKFSSRERRTAIRDKRNKEAIENAQIATINAALNVISDMQKKSLEENVTDIIEAAADAYLTGKIIEGVYTASKIIGTELIKTAEAFKKVVPPAVVDEYVVIMQASTGELIAVTEKIGKDLSIVAANQIAVNRAAQIEKFREQTALLVKEINETFKASKYQLAVLKKEIGKHLTYDKIIGVESLKLIQGPKSVEAFRKHTNNFTNLEKLEPEEIFHLNLCDWLEPQAVKINNSVKLSGGRHFVDKATGAIGFFEGYDLHHSLLGEMAPGALANRTSGGHLMIPELRGATLKMKEITPFGNDFFDMEIQYAGKDSAKFKNNSYFPAGTTVQQAVDMVEKAIANPKLIEYKINGDNKIVSFVVKDEADHFFTVYLEKNLAKFHPTNPKAIEHLL